jgi:quercetin dioxygenase-like cupin family protein
MSGEAHATVQVDDDGIRVTRYELGPGDRVAWHRHEHDYLVVPITDGAFEVVTADGRSAQRATAGEPYRRRAGAEHELVNGQQPYTFIEIEFVSSAPTASAPTHPRSS